MSISTVQNLRSGGINVIPILDVPEINNVTLTTATRVA